MIAGMMKLTRNGDLVMRSEGRIFFVMKPKPPVTCSQKALAPILNQVNLEHALTLG